MNFSEYQEKAATTAIYLDKLKTQIAIKALDADYNQQIHSEAEMKIWQILGLSYASLGLAGEAGELANKIKKFIRDGYDESKIESLKGELGDVLWYVAALAKELNLNLDEVAEENIKKLFSRKERGVLQGSGDNR